MKDPLNSLFNGQYRGTPVEEVVALAQGHPRYLEIISKKRLAGIEGMSSVLRRTVEEIRQRYPVQEVETILYHAIARRMLDFQYKVNSTMDFEEAIRRGYYYNELSYDGTLPFIAALRLYSFLLKKPHDSVLGDCARILIDSERHADENGKGLFNGLTFEMYHAAWESLVRYIRYNHYSDTKFHDKLPSIIDLYSDKSYRNSKFQFKRVLFDTRITEPIKKEPKTFEEFIKDEEGTCIYKSDNLSRRIRIMAR